MLFLMINYIFNVVSCVNFTERYLRSLSHDNEIDLILNNIRILLVNEYEEIQILLVIKISPTSTM